MLGFTNRLLIRRLPIGLFLVIISHHFYQVQSFHLSPWLGGGFAMFSTTDYGPSRFIKVHGLHGETIKEAITIPQRYDKLAKQVRSLPNDNNLSELARVLETYLAARQPRFQSLTITVWSSRYHPETLQPIFKILNNIEYKTVSNGSSS